ncbi:MAG: putative GTP cyclohydrolase 1 [Prokaryotic dsDNA virus sp.]|jgi:GTP cyclohydrolase I|nr:MAG: putative GTP cyclohydrolase 1 [Prokaryotic dsDNA virus sp.]|tara:strand:- start:13587 stop:14459 length:873 start_codon:yes stop_codon:yes gene_type:complete
MESNNRSLKWEEIYLQIDKILNQLENKKHKAYGIPRGGQVVVGMLGFCNEKIQVVEDPEQADIIVDDLYDSGTTYEKWKKKYPNADFYFLFDKREKEYKGKWLEFPWENSGDKEVEENVIRLLEYFGEDATREGLQDTPKRYVKFFKEFLSPPKWNCTTFEGEGYDEMIVQNNIPFHSLCEHHIAPFFGHGTIAYIPNKRIVGLSKLARTLETFARRLQNQERITMQVADFLEKELQPRGVAVILKAKHMCMEMRGVKKHNTWTTTSIMRGIFKEDDKARNEIMQIHNNK